MLLEAQRRARDLHERAKLTLMVFISREMAAPLPPRVFSFLIQSKMF